MLCYGQRYMSHNMNEDLLAEINGKLPQVATYYLWELWRITIMGGGGGVKYLLYGYVLLLNVTFLDNVGWRSLWIREVMRPAQERRGSNISFLELAGFSDGGFGNLALHHFLMDWRKSR